MGLEFIEDGFEFVGVDAGFGGGGHEVGVAGPAGDDVDVEVVGDAGSGAFPNVDSDIEAVGVEFRFEGGGDILDEGPEVGRFLGGEAIEVGDGAVGDDEGVPGVVGEAIEDGVAGLGAGEDTVGAVVLALAEPEEEVR